MPILFGLLEETIMMTKKQQKALATKLEQLAKKEDMVLKVVESFRANEGKYLWRKYLGEENKKKRVRWAGKVGNVTFKRSEVEGIKIYEGGFSVYRKQDSSAFSKTILSRDLSAVKTIEKGNNSLIICYSTGDKVQYFFSEYGEEKTFLGSIGQVYTKSGEYLPLTKATISSLKDSDLEILGISR